MHVLDCGMWLHLRLCNQIASIQSDMQAKYEALTQCLSEATVAPNSVSKQLDYRSKF